MNHLVIRHVAGQALAQPVVPHLSATRFGGLRVLHRICIVAGDVAELRRPYGSMHWMSQKFFNLAGTFVGPAIRHERADLFGGRQGADRIDGDAAQELVIVGTGRWRHVETLQLGEHVSIDEIGFR